MAPRLHSRSSMEAVLLSLWLIVGCTVGDPGPGPSTGSGTPTGGGGGGGGSTTPDAGGGNSAPACTGAPYDPCTDNTQCMAGNCKAFGMAALQVCTVTCTPGDNTTCPTQNGTSTTCNNMGICKPAAANSCTP